MAGYNDTRDLIISALMGRPAGTEIQPENHQAYALNMLDYIRSVELVSTSTLIGIAEENTVPVQPNDSQVCYIAGMSPNQTLTFVNFSGQDGNPISITTGSGEGKFILLLWNTEYWTVSEFISNLSNVVVQTIGSSETDVMSQKAVTDELAKKTDSGGSIYTLQEIEERISQIITTPAESVSAQEIIDARMGKISLGDKIRELNDGIFTNDYFEIL